MYIHAFTFFFESWLLSIYLHTTILVPEFCDYALILCYYLQRSDAILISVHSVQWR